MNKQKTILLVLGLAVLFAAALLLFLTDNRFLRTQVVPPAEESAFTAEEGAIVLSYALATQATEEEATCPSDPPEGFDCSMCSGSTPHCDTETYTCHQCISDDHCAVDETCQAGVCSQENIEVVECQTDADCAQGVCNMEDNSCVDCTDDSHCPADAICQSFLCQFAATPTPGVEGVIFQGEVLGEHIQCAMEHTGPAPEEYTDIQSIQKQEAITGTPRDIMIKICADLETSLMEFLPHPPISLVGRVERNDNDMFEFKPGKVSPPFSDEEYQVNAIYPFADPDNPVLEVEWRLRRELSDEAKEALASADPKLLHIANAILSVHNNYIDAHKTFFADKYKSEYLQFINAPKVPEGAYASEQAAIEAMKAVFDEGMESIAAAQQKNLPGNTLAYKHWNALHSGGKKPLPIEGFEDIDCYLGTQATIVISAAHDPLGATGTVTANVPLEKLFGQKTIKSYVAKNVPALTDVVIEVTPNEKSEFVAWGAAGPAPFLQTACPCDNPESSTCSFTVSPEVHSYSCHYTLMPKSEDDKHIVAVSFPSGSYLLDSSPSKSPAVFSDVSSGLAASFKINVDSGGEVALTANVWPNNAAKFKFGGWSGDDPELCPCLNDKDNPSCSFSTPEIAAGSSGKVYVCKAYGPKNKKPGSGPAMSANTNATPDEPIAVEYDFASIPPSAFDASLSPEAYASLSLSDEDEARSGVITIAQADQPSSEWIDDRFTDHVAGLVIFEPLPVGDYEARMFFDLPHEGFEPAYVFPISVRPSASSPTPTPSPTPFPTASPTPTPTPTPTPAPTPTTPSASTPKTSYAPEEPITVSFTNFSGRNDWIAIARPDQARNQWVAWQWTDRQTEGSITFTDTLPPGEYEIRVFQDWSDGGYTIHDTTSITITDYPSLPAATASSYTSADPVTVTWSNLPPATAGNRHWIAVSRQGQADNQWVAWAWVDHAAGSRTFNALPAGNYEVRTYYNWPEEGYDFRSRQPFTVSQTAAPEKQIYRADEPVVITWNNLPQATEGNRHWVTIARQDQANNQWEDWKWIDTATGSHTFNALPAGNYEVRTYYNWRDAGYTVIGDPAPFTVDQGFHMNVFQHTSGQATVSFYAFPGTTDWITIARPDQARNQWVAWQWTDKQEEGNLIFDRLPSGNYELRAYRNWMLGGYTIQRRVPFRILEDGRSAMGE